MKKMLLITASVALIGIVSTANAEDAGEKTYKMACFACHGTGAAGAPKLGDKAAWQDRIAQGNATLHEHALKGFKGKTGFMPAKGGRTDISDDDVKAAVDYMVSNSK
jgi:cytochrome c5